MAKLLISLINFYQIFLSFDQGLLRVLSPAGACKGSPTCSQFTKQAILKYGALKGGVLGFKRILSCNPWT